MLTVHHLNNSRSQRILWLLEELQVPYALKRYERDPRTMLAPPELRAISALGKAPILTDDGPSGRIVVAESGAIIEYVLDRYGEGRLRPAAGSSEALRFTYWLHYAEGSAMPPLLMKLVFNRIEQTPMPIVVKQIAKGICRKVNTALIDPQIALHFNFVDSELAKFPWFAGETFSAADIQMSFAVEGALARGGGAARWPHMAAFLERIHARPAYVAALGKGGPFSLAR